MWLKGFRDEIWSRLDQPWDLVIIGGGITGAGILGEAVRHGKKVLLVEAQDFSSGTSSRSTKLVHGGLRYLRQGQFLVTRKSVRERERLMQEGAGLVNPLGFSLGVFPGDQMPKWMYGVGLAMYDALAGKWAHEAQSREEIIARVQSLDGSQVEGGYRYFDAQTDDSRLTLRVLREAVKQGGSAINYVRAEKLLRTADGRVRGVVVRDMAPGASRTAEVQAKVVINATGAWADELRAELGQEGRLRRIRGSHLTFEHRRVPLPEAVSLLHPRDQRGGDESDREEEPETAHTFRGIRSERPRNRVARAEEVAVAQVLAQVEVEAAREERAAGAERDRRDGHDDLVQEAVLGELAGEVAAAHDPQTAVARGLRHRGVHLGHEILGEGGVRPDRLELAVGEDPARDVVHPGLAGLREVVAQPLVRGGAHRDRPDVLDELGVGERSLIAHVLLEEPLQRVVLVGDVAVESGRGEVGGRHAGASVRRRSQLMGSPSSASPPSSRSIARTPRRRWAS